MVCCCCCGPACLPPAAAATCSNLPEADSAIQQLFELALGALRQAGATLVDNFAIQGNSYGQDWDAARGGQGPAIGEAGSRHFAWGGRQF